MLIIDKYKLLFISNPKTGTTLVQTLLLTLAPDLRLNRLPARINGGNEKQVLFEHMRAKEAKQVLGSHWEDYKSFLFVRNPYEKSVSTYFFYLNGQPITRKDNKRKLQVYVNQFLVNTLPFGLWLLVKKVRSNYEYILDDNDVIIVNHVGKNENLIPNLNKLLNLYGIDETFESRERVNTSKHKDYTEYFKNKMVKRFFDWRYKKDVVLFEKLKNIEITTDLKGKKLTEI